MISFSNPRKIISSLNVPPDAHIADFGSGTGVYSLLLAEGYPQRTIFAIDIQKELVASLGKEAEKRGLRNVHTVWGDIDEIKGSFLRDDSMDYVFLVNTLFQVEDPIITLREAKRVLKQDGRLILIDWVDSYGNLGPHEDHVISQERAIQLAEELGFIQEANMEDVGEHHYGIIFRKI